MGYSGPFELGGMVMMCSRTQCSPTGQILQGWVLVGSFAGGGEGEGVSDGEGGFLFRMPRSSSIHSLKSRSRVESIDES